MGEGIITLRQVGGRALSAGCPQADKIALAQDTGAVCVYSTSSVAATPPHPLPTNLCSYMLSPLPPPPAAV